MPRTKDRAQEAIDSARQGLTEIHIRNKGRADQQVISRYLKDKTNLKSILSKFDPKHKLVDGKWICLDS